MRTLLALLLLPLAALADGTKYSVSYPASEKPGELIFASTYNLWLPEGVKTVRGIIVHQHGCGLGSNKGARPSPTTCIGRPSPANGIAPSSAR